MATLSNSTSATIVTGTSGADLVYNYGSGVTISTGDGNDTISTSDGPKGFSRQRQR